MREQTLYPPVKAFLEAQGYEVKGEVNDCDVVAIRGEEPPIIVELKTGFSPPLVFQGIVRQGLSDNVYLAVPPFSGRMTRRKDALTLCRRLGLGLLTVRLEPETAVEALLDPAPYRPRQRKRDVGWLLREFRHRVGDPNQGGSTRRTIMTAYRQDALRCASHLRFNDPTKAAVTAKAAGVPRAREFEPSAQAIRNWVAQAGRDAGKRTNGLRSEEREELRRRRRENRRRREEREIPANPSTGVPVPVATETRESGILRIEPRWSYPALVDT